MEYCSSRYRARRRPTREVKVGSVGIGGDNPLRVQSMTTTPTMDVAATVEQSIRLAEAGCEIVRITAQNLDAARALGEIRQKLNEAKIEVPLVADIHFLPKAALEAAEHVEKVRINPGNYADKKKFAVQEYSDDMYEEELERLYEAFSPIVLKCKELGRAMRIGTNHGSLSDRIMNRYGDTPLGMVESALEFIRIAESHGYREIVLSMKASNPKVMIQAYRLAVARMAQENMPYPLHLGVTEAGDGDDARIKSAMGIGALLADGLGDTIRVSLTEDPVYEVPVARDLAEKAHQLWEREACLPLPDPKDDSLDPYSYTRRAVEKIELGLAAPVGPMEPPRVIIPAPTALSHQKALVAEVRAATKRFRDCPVEALLVCPANGEEAARLPALRAALPEVGGLVVDMAHIGPGHLTALHGPHVTLLAKLEADDTRKLKQLATFARKKACLLALDVTPETVQALAEPLRELSYSGIISDARIIFTLSGVTTAGKANDQHPLARYRALAEALRTLDRKAPLWIRATAANTIDPQEGFGDRLMEASILVGGLLCDGLGDMVSIETEPDFARALTLAYNILQGARTRSTKTEYVACPSCGRTLFDLESTTQRIRERTGHLKGVTIAVMGCIVNGPGEMADADFGYVGGAPGKVNLYVGKTAVKFNIPTAEAVDRLIDLIKEHGKWVEPELAEVS